MPGLSPAVVDRLAEAGRVRTLRRGERLIHEGSSAGAVIMPLEGTVRVTRIVGGDEVVVAIRGPGDLLGELGPMTGGVAGASVEAREPGRLVVMASSRFMSAQRAHPEIAEAVLERLVAMLAQSDRRLVNAQCRLLIERVAHELLDLATFEDTTTPEPGHSVLVTQAELASLCIASRSAVAEAVATLRSDGVIETRRGHIRILDPNALLRHSLRGRS